jgi:hypothetical protein
MRNLLDPPCSGCVTFNKHDDLTLTITEQDEILWVPRPCTPKLEDIVWTLPRERVKHNTKTQPIDYIVDTRLVSDHPAIQLHDPVMWLHVSCPFKQEEKKK